MRTINPKDADKLFKDNWFEGYTDKVEVYDDTITVNIFLDEFEKDEEEFIIFNNGLNAKTMDFSDGLCSIYAVNGNVETENLLIGDSIIIIRGLLKVKNWVFMPENHGILSINDEQFSNKDTKILNHIDCPLIILYAMETGETCVFKKEGKQYLKAKPSELIDEIIDDNEVDQYAIADILNQSKSIFK